MCVQTTILQPLFSSFQLLVIFITLFQLSLCSFSLSHLCYVYNGWWLVIQIYTIRHTINRALHESQGEWTFNSITLFLGTKWSRALRLPWNVSNKEWQVCCHSLICTCTMVGTGMLRTHIFSGAKIVTYKNGTFSK